MNGKNTEFLWERLNKPKPIPTSDTGCGKFNQKQLNQTRKKVLTKFLFHGYDGWGVQFPALK